jgi:2,4-dienoyl-CoA reductase-like NADH-dependent reductase (Old Yellow Enzyme family)
MNKYPHLFSEGQIGNLTIRNRIIMAPMGTLLAQADGQVSEHQIAYYAERARAAPD